MIQMMSEEFHVRLSDVVKVRYYSKSLRIVILTIIMNIVDEILSNLCTSLSITIDAEIYRKKN